MSAGADTAPGTHAPDNEGGPAPRDSYRDNQQRLGQGMAVMGGIGGDANVFIGVPHDEDVSERILKPRLREGPYPADDVHARLRGFVEPPTHAQCRKGLDNHILVLRAGNGTGAGTAAFAVLAERYGVDGITDLDSPDDLSRWRPNERRGYLLQGLSPVAAASLGEVVLTALASLLHRSGAHLVITVRMETPLPGDTVPWQVTHRPPPPASSPPSSSRCTKAPSPRSPFRSTPSPEAPTWHDPWPGRAHQTSIDPDWTPAQACVALFSCRSRGGAEGDVASALDHALGRYARCGCPRPGAAAVGGPDALRVGEQRVVGGRAVAA